jgi:hypothetical protein
MRAMSSASSRRKAQASKSFLGAVWRLAGNWFTLFDQDVHAEIRAFVADDDVSFVDSIMYFSTTVGAVRRRPCLPRFAEILPRFADGLRNEGTRIRERHDAPLIGITRPRKQFITTHDTFIANPDLGTGDKLGYLVMVFVAKATMQFGKCHQSPRLLGKQGNFRVARPFDDLSVHHACVEDESY